MKRLSLIGMLAVCAAASTASAQTDQEIIDRAVAAAPRNAQAAAMVVKWNADGTRVVVRPGTNGMVCWDQSAWPHQQPFSAHCTSAANLPRVEQNREFFLKATSAPEAEKLVQASEKDGSRKVPEYGAAWMGLVGKDQASARAHITIAVPFATTENSKLPSKPVASSAWIMNPGTSAAHIMVPGH